VARRSCSRSSSCPCRSDTTCVGTASPVPLRRAPTAVPARQPSHVSTSQPPGAPYRHWSGGAASSRLLRRALAFLLLLGPPRTLGPLGVVHFAGVLFVQVRRLLVNLRCLGARLRRALVRCATFPRWARRLRVGLRARR